MVRLSPSLLVKRGSKFIDSVYISVRGGRGGNGLPRYCGVGGKGGDVYAEACDKYTLKMLKDFYPKQRIAGGPGSDSKKFQILGSPGDDVIIKCPAGVTAKSNSCIIGDLNTTGERLLLARGGVGGHPNNGYLGQKGQSLSITLDLKLLADVGFVGYPNAGKSTLLAALSNAKPKIASYPFTTISPNIGILMYKDLRKVQAADLPGLIEGAHLNYGMGHKFLKHCLRTKVLLFVVDIDGFKLNPWTSHRDAFQTIVLLNKELQLYDEDLISKPAILAVNKIDEDCDGAKFERLKEQIKNYEESIQTLPDDFRPSSLMKFGSVVPISAKMGTNIELLKNKIRTIIDISEEQKRIEESSQLVQYKSDVIYA